MQHAKAPTCPSAHSRRILTPERSTTALLPRRHDAELAAAGSQQRRARRGAAERNDLSDVRPRPSNCGAAPPQKPPREPKARRPATRRLAETNVRPRSDERSGFAREATASPRKLIFSAIRPRGARPKRRATAQFVGRTTVHDSCKIAEPATLSPAPPPPSRSTRRPTSLGSRYDLRRVTHQRLRSCLLAHATSIEYVCADSG